MSSSKTPFWLGGMFVLYLFFVNECTIMDSLGVAGSMAACFTHPLDLTKLRMQTVKTVDGQKPSMLRVIRETIVSSGPQSLYVGLSASLLRQMTYSLVRLGTYDTIKHRITKGKRPSNGQLLLAAGISGGLGGIAGNPADILLVRMTTDPLKPPDTRYKYTNAFQGLFRLMRDEGFHGLIRGLTPNTVRAVLMNTSQLASYDYFKTYLLYHGVPFTRIQLQDNLLLHTIASSLAGTIATTVCSPADVVKARIMASADRSSILGILAKSFREEGVMFMFKGWMPAFIRLGPNTVMMFVFLEQLKSGWRYYTQTFS